MTISKNFRYFYNFVLAIFVRANFNYKSKKFTKEFFITMKTKIKKYDERWLERIQRSRTNRLYQ